jgi:hypothetical protein
MTGKRTMFFATPPDLDGLLTEIEAAEPLQFIEHTFDDTPAPRRHESLKDAPRLGHATSDQTVNGIRYIVAARDTIIQPRLVPQRKGGIRYAWDQQANPHTIAFSPGGIYEDGVLIAGEVTTIGTNDELYARFAKALKRQFAKEGLYYVGGEALRLWKSGWRLTHGARSPREYDMK